MKEFVEEIVLCFEVWGFGWIWDWGWPFWGFL